MDLKEKIDNLPIKPGIYLMKDKYDNVIYVGKSVNLRSRVKSYFRENINRSKKIEQMVKFIRDVDYLVTDTELDALLLECDYIHDIRPIYNTLMNNYEKYKYLKLDINSLNLIDVVDDKEIDKDATYFGPFSMNKSLNALREFLLDYFKLPTCNSKSKCIRYDIKKCLGPCIVDSSENYKKIYKILLDTFYGKKYFLEELQEEMRKSSTELDFERAMEIKNNLELLKSISHKQNVLNWLEEDCKLLLWIKVDEKRYKIYLINGVQVEFSEIVEVEKFNDYHKNELIRKIEKFKKESKKINYDKSYIDYINIIYSYIYKENKINYIKL